VPGVARVLHHLGDTDVRADERPQSIAYTRDGAARVGGVIVPDQRERRFAEVLERGAFAEKLGVDGDPEPLPVLLARRALEHRDDDPMRRAREHGAADDDDVVTRFVLQRRADLLAHNLPDTRDRGCRSLRLGVPTHSSDTSLS